MACILFGATVAVTATGEACSLPVAFPAAFGSAPVAEITLDVTYGANVQPDSPSVGEISASGGVVSWRAEVSGFSTLRGEVSWSPDAPMRAPEGQETATAADEAPGDSVTTEHDTGAS